MRLNIDVLAPEYLAGAIARDVLGHVNEFAAPIIPLPWIAFGVLIRQHRAKGFEHSFGNEILRSNHLKVISKPALFVCYSGGYLRVNFKKRSVHDSGHLLHSLNK